MSHEHRFRITNEEGPTVWLDCPCGLGERRRYTPDGLLYELRWKLPDGVDWIDPIAILSTEFPGVVCTLCAGRSTDEPCRGCNGLGLLRAPAEKIPLRK